MTAKSTDEGELDLLRLKDLAKRDAAGIRERAEAEGLARRDGRKRRRKNRTDLISYRVKPETRAAIERLAEAEDCSYVEIVERAIELLDRTLTGKK